MTSLLVIAAIGVSSGATFATYCLGYSRGSTDGYAKGVAYERAREESQWPAEPPPVIMYSSGPHLPNDCGACTEYRPIPRGNGPKRAA